MASALAAPADVRVLLVLGSEDRPDADLLRALRRSAMAVDEVTSPDEGRWSLDEVDYDAVVVPAAETGDDRHVFGRQLPARVALVVRVDGAAAGAHLEAFGRGADEAVDLDVPHPELALRVAKAAARRAGVGRGAVRLGRVMADVVTREITLDGEPVTLTPHQRAVFLHLVAHRERLVSSSELLEHCWDAATDPFADPVSSQITRLRGAMVGALEVRWSSQGGYRLLVVDTGPDRS